MAHPKVDVRHLREQHVQRRRPFSPQNRCNKPTIGGTNNIFSQEVRGGDLEESRGRLKCLGYTFAVVAGFCFTASNVGIK